MDPSLDKQTAGVARVLDDEEEEFRTSGAEEIKGDVELDAVARRNGCQQPTNCFARIMLSCLLVPLEKVL